MFSIELRVRYPEADPMGVVHHSHFFEYFEIARIEHLRSHGIAYRDLEKQGIFFAIVKAACQLKSPAYCDDILPITPTLERSSLVRIDHAYAVHRKAGGKLLAEGQTTLACLGADFQPRPMPEEILAMFRAKSGVPRA